MGALVICGLRACPSEPRGRAWTGRQPGLGCPPRVRGLRQTPFAPGDRWRNAVRHGRRGARVVEHRRAQHAAVLLGDAMFLAASALGALYVLQLRAWGVGAIQGCGHRFALLGARRGPVVLSGPRPHRCGASPPLELVVAGALAGRADRLRRAYRAQPRHFASLGAERSSALSRAQCRCSAAILALGFLGEVPSADRDGGVRRDCRRRLDRRVAAATRAIRRPPARR